MRRLAIFLAIPIFAFCADGPPIDGLATNEDGSVLYFSSRFKLRGSSDPDHPKIFRLDSKGLAVHASRSRADYPEAHVLTDPAVSRDGSTFTYVAANALPCTGESCDQKRVESTYFTHRGFALALPGRWRVSRNGRFAIRNGVTGAHLRDLDNGQDAPLPADCVPRDVTSQGQVLCESSKEGPPSVWTADGARPISLTDRSAAVYALSDDGSSLLHAPSGAYPGTTRLVRLRDGVSKDILGSPVFLSRDGQTVLFRRGWPFFRYDLQQLFIYQVNGAVERRLSYFSDGVDTAAVSDDGRIAYVKTGANRLFKVDIETGASIELIAATPEPRVAVDGNLVAPGALLRVEGSGFSTNSSCSQPATAYGIFTQEVAGTRFMLGPRAAPVGEICSYSATLQVPFEQPLGIWPLRLQPYNGPFETPSLEIRVVDFAPQFLTPHAVHQNFSGPVTASSPARPGQYLHLYLTGMGTVTPPVESGFPALGTDSRTDRVLNARIAGAPADVSFSGLAPGLVGVYQVTVQVPSDLAVAPEETAVVPVDFGIPDARGKALALDIWVRR